MAHRHLVAVCVVCLLCAEHLPCKAHIFLSSNSKNINYENSIEWKTGNDISREISSLYPVVDDVTADRSRDKIKENENEMLSRKKRHADHSHLQTYHRIEMPEVTKTHIDRLFHQFSNQATLNVHGFEDMVTRLNLGHLFNVTGNKSCMSEEAFLLKLTHGKDAEDHHEHHEHSHKHDDDSHTHDDDSHTHEDHSHHDLELSQENMMSICPILLYYILNRDTALSDNSCFDIAHFNVNDSNENVQLIQMEDRKLVWLYSTLSVLVVSLSGLCVVVVIPIMDKTFYHLILQFLVALAIGSMAGDALLHLLPHAMLPLTPDQDLHTSMMHRGLIVIGCMIFSYFFERFIAAVMECRQRKDRREKKSTRVRVVRESESQSANATTCKHKYSSYPYCYDEINMETKDNHHNHHHNEEEEILTNHKDIIIKPTNDTNKVNGLTHDNSNDADNNTLTLSTSIDNGSIESSAIFNNSKQSGNPISHSASGNVKCDDLKDEKLTVILREHHSKHHGHSHTHGHVHSPPESLSAVAWMVILGDGLHNFTDGMAIGAAFSNSLAGGFSTALAVLCHELPHELGDFAVLLKAGMSPKKAICYNILTGVLCVLGMVFGILLGDTPETSQYIFAGTAGLFIYIALVDMMPELTSSHGKEGSCMLIQCSLQFSGMLLGLMSMLFIAIYEHDLKEIFTS